MRIENQTKHNNSSAFNKKNKTKKITKEQEALSENSDQLDLSSGVILLNRLLEAPEHQYKPLPFYFSNATMKNTKQASSIAKAIQKKAKLYDTNLNYNMILDLVLSHSQESEKSNNALYNNPEHAEIYQYVLLQNSESAFFEKFHKESVRHKIPETVISTIVLKYSLHIKNTNLKISTTNEQIQLLAQLINNTNNSSISSNKNALLNILKVISKKYFLA